MAAGALLLLLLRGAGSSDVAVEPCRNAVPSIRNSIHSLVLRASDTVQLTFIFNALSSNCDVTSLSPTNQSRRRISHSELI